MVATMFILLTTVILIRFLNSFDLTVLDSKVWPIVATKYVFLTVILISILLQTVFCLKTGEDNMLTRVIKLSIIIMKVVVVIILSNITWYILEDGELRNNYDRD